MSANLAVSAMGPTYPRYPVPVSGSNRIAAYSGSRPLLTFYTNRGTEEEPSWISSAPEINGQLVETRWKVNRWIQRLEKATFVYRIGANRNDLSYLSSEELIALQGELSELPIDAEFPYGLYDAPFLRFPPMVSRDQNHEALGVIKNGDKITFAGARDFYTSAVNPLEYVRRCNGTLHYDGTYVELAEGRVDSWNETFFALRLGNLADPHLCGDVYNINVGILKVGDIIRLKYDSITPITIDAPAIIEQHWHNNPYSGPPDHGPIALGTKVAVASARFIGTGDILRSTGFGFAASTPLGARYQAVSSAIMARVRGDFWTTPGSWSYYIDEQGSVVNAENSSPENIRARKHECISQWSLPRRLDTCTGDPLLPPAEYYVVGRGARTWSGNGYLDFWGQAPEDAAAIQDKLCYMESGRCYEWSQIPAGLCVSIPYLPNPQDVVTCADFNKSLWDDPSTHGVTVPYATADLLESSYSGQLEFEVTRGASGPLLLHLFYASGTVTLEIERHPPTGGIEGPCSWNNRLGFTEEPDNTAGYP